MPFAGAGEFTHAFFALVAILIRKWLTGGELGDSRLVPVLQNGRRLPFFVDERSTHIRAVTMRLNTRPPEGQRLDVSHEASVHLRPCPWRAVSILDVGMTDRWFYAEDGATRGPAPFDDLVSLLSRRRDWARVLVWRDGLDGWTRADKVPEIVSRIVVPPRPQATASSRNQPLALSKRFKGLLDENALVMLGVMIGTALVLAWTMLLIR
jgi:GYF domain 2